MNDKNTKRGCMMKPPLDPIAEQTVLHHITNIRDSSISLLLLALDNRAPHETCTKLANDLTKLTDVINQARKHFNTSTRGNA